MKHILKKTLLLLTSLIAVLALSACGSKTKIDLTEYVIVDISGVSGYAYAHAYDDNDRLEVLVLGDEDKDSAASWVKLDLLMQIDYDIDKSEYLSNGDTITVTVTYPEELAEALDADVTPKSGESWTVEVRGLEELHEYDVFADLDVTFEGVNGYGKPIIQINGGTQVGWEFSQEEELSNGDTVTMTLTGPNGRDLLYYCTEEGFVPTAESKEFTVTGLVDAPIIDLFEDIDITVEGRSPFLSLHIRGKYENDGIGYRLEESATDGLLAVGDTVTIQAYGQDGWFGEIDLAEKCMDKLEGLPAEETYIYSIPAPQEYYLMEQEQLTEVVLAKALAEAHDIFDAEEKAEELSIQGVTYYGYYLQSVKSTDIWGDRCRLYIIHEVTYSKNSQNSTSYNVVRFVNPYVDKDGTFRSENTDIPYDWVWDSGIADLYDFEQKYITPDKANYTNKTGK